MRQLDKTIKMVVYFAFAKYFFAIFLSFTLLSKTPFWNQFLFPLSIDFKRLFQADDLVFHSGQRRKKKEKHVFAHISDSIGHINRFVFIIIIYSY